MKRINIKLFMIPILIIFLLFSFLGYAIIDSRIKNNYEHLEHDVNILAKNFAEIISKSQEATALITEVFNEKILAAGKISEIYEGHESNSTLKEIANILSIDEIYYYNPEGEVLFSSTGEYIDWKAEEGHPVRDFIDNGKKTYIEGIRAETVTGELYKFGYYRLDNNYFYQIAIKESNISNTLKEFNLTKILQNMVDEGMIKGVNYHDAQGNMVAKIGNSFEYETKDNYHVAQAPVVTEDGTIGTLEVLQSNDIFQDRINEIIFQSLVVFALMTLTLIWILRTIYNQSKKHHHLAYFDYLTGLPNFDYFKEFLDEKIGNEENQNQGVCLISLRNLKTMNLIYGLDYGEEIILEVAKRLEKLVSEEGKVFKYNVDQFAIYLEGYKDKNELLSLIQKIIKVIEAPYKGKLGNQHINPALGILELKGKDGTSDFVIKNVYLAMTYAKENPYISYKFYDEQMELLLKREDIIEKAIREVIDEENSTNFHLEYQPKLDVKTNKIAGFEALARLYIPELGQVPPPEFIAVAEKSLLISDFGKRIYYEALKFITEMENEGFKHIPVAINISGIQLTGDDFPNFEINNKVIEFEITESVILNNFDNVNGKLSMLRNKGIKISLDDFGTGFSSMARLRELNIDIIKIDKYFIDRIGKEGVKQNQLITSDIISMAHKLELTVIAEGVENERQKEYLLENNCDIIQGYLFSRPLISSKALDFIREMEK